MAVISLVTLAIGNRKLGFFFLIIRAFPSTSTISDMNDFAEIGVLDAVIVLSEAILVCVSARVLDASGDSPTVALGG